MPTKPNEETINAAKKKLKPQDVVIAIINETPELRQAAIDAGVVVESEE